MKYQLEATTGRCPVCQRKPLTYKRQGKYFCCRCCRDYDIKTGEQILPTSFFDEAGIRKGKYLPSVEQVCEWMEEVQ